MVACDHFISLGQLRWKSWLNL